MMCTYIHTYIPDNQSMAESNPSPVKALVALKRRDPGERGVQGGERDRGREREEAYIIIH